MSTPTESNAKRARVDDGAACTSLNANQIAEASSEAGKAAPPEAADTPLEVVAIFVREDDIWPLVMRFTIPAHLAKHVPMRGYLQTTVLNTNSVSEHELPITSIIYACWECHWTSSKEKAVREIKQAVEREDMKMWGDAEELCSIEFEKIAAVDGVACDLTVLVETFQ